MKVTTFCKFGITAGAVALLVGGLAVPAATADPAAGTYGTLVGFGSDTTQDVVNGLAAALGGNKVASYDATGTTSTVVVRDGGVAVPRGSGSTPGRDMLRVAIGQTSSATVAVAPTGTASATGANTIGQIDFARSSSAAPSAEVSNEGVLAYIPFARDAVSVAVDPDSPLAVVPFSLGDLNNVGSDIPSLYNVYRGTVKFAYVTGTAGSYTYYGVGGTNTVPAAAPAGTVAYQIQPLLPKSGSGTRSFFIGKIGLSEANITALPAGTIKSTYGANLDVQEHDGTAINGDLTAIAPFSIAQWVAQANAVEGVTDRRHDVVLLPLNGTASTTQSGSVYSTNPAFSAMTRDVYNIVPSKLADDATSDIAKTFVGSDSLVCQATSTITAYGFQLLPTTCGSTSQRAYTASPSSVAVAFDETTVAANGTITATATVNSGNHAQGGLVEIVDAFDNVVGSAPLTAGATSVEIDVTPTVVGTASLTTYFTPTLAGIAGSKTEATSVTVVAAPTVTSISAPSTVKVGATVPVITWIEGADATGGTVTLKEGETVLATTKLGAGETGAYLTFVAKKTSYSLVATYTAPTGSTTAGSESAVKALTIGKGTPKVSTGTIATVAASKNSKFTVVVTGVSGAVPTGTVTIKEGSKTLVLNKAISSTTGKVSITLPKLKKGTHKVTITYSGDNSWNTATKSSVVVKIK
jgi:hypothetical protein